MRSSATSSSLRFLDRAARSLGLVLALASLVWAAGCGGSKGKNEVTGKVTLDGQPVVGNVVFVGSDGKEVMALIRPDGTYTIPEPPMGEVKIKVIGLVGLAPPGQGSAAAPAAGAGASGVAPPEKYASADNGLTFNVTGGKQTKDLPLTK